MNPNQYKVSKERYEEFQKHYTWQWLKNPNFRLGQAFLNYFNEVDKIMEADGDLGLRTSHELYYEPDNERAQQIIDRWREL